MSDSDGSTSDVIKKSVNWVYYLRKEQVFRLLKEKQIKYEEFETLDVLRKRLAEAIRSEQEPSRNQTSAFCPLITIEPPIDLTANNGMMATEAPKLEAPKLEFHLKSDDWETFVNRLEIYF
ncbi:hypothetical protein PUN28_016961 [Cardiocondyla obscurior]|uniref:Uncharacterized protein n=1 Tax=Cardiocondyla obscurior TaxID=286306 RepID=A0AAW2EPI9_9HYME